MFKKNFFNTFLQTRSAWPLPLIVPTVAINAFKGDLWKPQRVKCCHYGDKCPFSSSAAAHHNTPPQGKVLLQTQPIILLGQKFRTDCQGTTSHLALWLDRKACASRAAQHPLTPRWIIHSASIQRKHAHHFLEHPAFEGLPFSVSTGLKVAQISKKKQNLSSTEWLRNMKKIYIHTIYCF